MIDRGLTIFVGRCCLLAAQNPRVLKDMLQKCRISRWFSPSPSARRALLIFDIYHLRMARQSDPSQCVTLALQDSQGRSWPLRLSRDCLRFVGAYRRIEGFNIDAMLLFDGVRKAG